MTAPFFSRLRAYYGKVGSVLRGEAEAASIFPNATDIGTSRERIYAEFLRLHVPSRCNVLFGGFLFDETGVESKQIDVIVTTDTCPRFDFHNPKGDGKAFACVEGTLACVSIKSMLDRSNLREALTNIASIPLTRPLAKRIIPNLSVSDYEDWPFKVLYASDGVLPSTLMEHLQEFYAEHSDIPFSRRPNLIHVAGKVLILRSAGKEILRASRRLEKGEFVSISHEPDVQAITWTIDGIQHRAMSSGFILFQYGFLINKVFDPAQPGATDNPDDAQRI